MASTTFTIKTRKHEQDAPVYEEPHAELWCPRVLVHVIYLLVAGTMGATAFGASLTDDRDGHVTASSCAPCHHEEYEEWSISAHAGKQVECYECHGGFHSASLLGCKHCHNATHRRRLHNWPAVNRFDAGGDASDYMCVICHNAHNGGLQKNLIGCYPCHGSMAHDVLSDVMHARIASAVTPVHIDEFARERDGLVPRLMNMPRWRAAVSALVAAPLFYLGCFVLVLPAGYTAFAAWDHLWHRSVAVSEQQF